MADPARNPAQAGVTKADTESCAQAARGSAQSSAHRSGLARCSVDVGHESGFCECCARTDASALRLTRLEDQRCNPLLPSRCAVTTGVDRKCHAKSLMHACSSADVAHSSCAGGDRVRSCVAWYVISRLDCLLPLACVQQWSTCRRCQPACCHVLQV